MLCQRYYQIISALNGIGNFYSTAQIVAAFPFPIPMRTAPTVGATGTINFTDTGANYTQSSSGLAGTNATSTDCFIYVGNLSGVTAYRPYWYTSYNSSSKVITMSAEL